MIHDAARSATKDKFVRLVSKLGKDSVSKRERDYEQTPLHIACDAGRTEIVQLLLEKYKVEVNPVDKNGWTPLHHAAASGQLPICEMLLGKGASARSLSNEGASPLHYLVRHNPSDPALFARVLQLMLLNRADVNQQNKHGETPLHQASHRGRDAVVGQLISAGATASLATKHGETPLHFAVRAGQKSVVPLLLSAGADAAAVSTSGTPLELSKPYPEITEMLRKKLGQGDSGTVLSPLREVSTLGRIPEPLSPKGAHALLTDSGAVLQPTTSSTSVVSVLTDDESLSVVDGIDMSTLTCPACTKTCAPATVDDAPRAPVHFHTKAPHQWLVLRTEEQESRGRLSHDLCVLDEQHFIRGLIELRPIERSSVGGDAVVVFGVWVKVPKHVFEAVIAMWSKIGREKDPNAKFTGELATSIPCYTDCLSLKVQVQIRERGKRPSVEVLVADSPLHAEQRIGIPHKRIRELCLAMLRKEIPAAARADE